MANLLGRSRRRMAVALPLLCALASTLLVASAPRDGVASRVTTDEDIAAGVLPRPQYVRGTGVSVSVVCPNGIRTNRGARELIARQGLAGRLTCQYPEQVARAALRGMLAGKAVIVPGRVNRFIRLASGLVPRQVAMGVITRRWNAETPRADGGARTAGSRDRRGAKPAGWSPWRRADARV